MRLPGGYAAFAHHIWKGRIYSVFMQLDPPLAQGNL
jgi:hypothetical protein